MDDGDYDSFRQSYESIKEDFKDDEDIIVPELEEICDFIYENILYNLPHKELIGESKELKDGYPWESIIITYWLEELFLIEVLRLKIL